jgi:hypothetical protein
MATDTTTREVTRITTDHDEIRRWAEAHGARPARVKGTGGPGDPGILRLDLPGDGPDPNLEEISWDEWFRAFDENRLALVYEDETVSGKRSTFNKLVSRETAQERARR